MSRGVQRRKGVTDRRVMVSLRGVRLCEHPKNPEDLRGLLVPWEQVSFWSHQGNGFIELFGPDGRKPRGLRAHRLPLRAWECQLARRAWKRGIARRLDSGEIMLVERFDLERADGIAALLVSCLVAAMVAWLLIQRGGSWLRLPGPGATAVDWVVFGLGVAGWIALPLAALFLVRVAWAKFRPGLARVAMSGMGIEVERRDGGIVRREWSELRRVRAGWIRSTLEFEGGERIALPWRRCGLVVGHHRRRLHPREHARDERRGRWTLVRILMYFQLAGVAAAAIAASVPGAGPSPWRAYGFVALAHPLAASVGVGLIWTMRWCSKQTLRAQRRRRGLRATGRAM